MGKVQRLSAIVTSDYSHFIKERDIVTSDYSDYNTKRNKKSYSEQQARSRAEYLASKLSNPSRRMFYLKCAWNLTDSYLDRLLQIALTKHEPALYFSKSASREMIKNS